MKRTSLAHAKAHLSELVNDAEHRGKRIVILRHGKPAAAIVPVEVVQPPRLKRRMSLEEAQAFLQELGQHANSELSPVEDLFAGRR
jgi:prevent-host-death family protein